MRKAPWHQGYSGAQVSNDQGTIKLLGIKVIRVSRSRATKGAQGALVSRLFGYQGLERSRKPWYLSDPDPIGAEAS
jgi:hypothetical protein